MIEVDWLKDAETERKVCESTRNKLEENKTESQGIKEVGGQQWSAYIVAAEEVLRFRKDLESDR